MADERPIWQRIETDTDKSFAAFCVYRDLGADRSLEKAWNQYQNSTKTVPGYFKDWSSTHNWVERAAAYDDYVLDEHRREIEQRRKVVQSNEWKDYLALRKGIDKRVKVMEETNWMNTTSENINSLLSLIQTADDYARRIVGLPDKITESKQEHSGSITWEQVVSEARKDVDNSDPYA